ncbi:YesL family protein [Natronospora cellulosivora (SeqCode)]
MDNDFFNSDGTLFKVFEWVSRLVFLNLLWIFFTILGLGIFGFMPATLATFSQIYKWLDGKNNIKLLKEFWKDYKASFIRINLIGFVMIIIAFILYIDLSYFQERTGILFSFLTIIVWLLIFFYIFVFIYMFPIFLKYDLKIYYILKNALFFVFITPKETVQMILALILPLIFFRYLPSLLPFLGVSLPIFLISWVSNKTLYKVEEKVRQNN